MSKPLDLSFHHIAIPAFVVMCLAFNGVFAQIEWGVKAGINSDFIKTNGLTTPSTANPPATIGIHTGVFGNKKISDDWNLLGEIQYIRKGSRSIFPQLPRNQRINFEYFDLSLLPGYQVTDQFVVEAGPTVSLQTRLLFSEAIVSPSESVQFAVNVGVRCAITPQLTFSTRYYHALTPFQNFRHSNDLNQYEGTSQFFYRTLQLSLGYTITRADK